MASASAPERPPPSAWATSTPTAAPSPSAVPRAAATASCPTTTPYAPPCSTTTAPTDPPTFSSPPPPAKGKKRIVRTARQRAGLRKKVCPHLLRHCFAVHYLDHGGNLLRLKQLLGHAHVSTTLRYLSYANPELSDIPSPLHFLHGARP